MIRYTADTRDLELHADERPDPAAVRYRLLCGTRNLNFDRSWDTMLVLEGDLRRDRPHVIRRNGPLSAFVQALPQLTSSPIGSEREKAIQNISEELLRVEFRAPVGFGQHADDLVFWPIGIGQKDTWPFGGRTDRLLVISPFVDKTCLSRLKEQADLRALVSRSEELDSLPPVALAGIESCFVLSDAAELDLREDEAANAATPTYVEEKKSDDDVPVEPSLASLRGLHAKLYVADCGKDARVWTGSANATEAAFSVNVEFLVELRGRRADLGIDILLREEPPTCQHDRRVRLRDMLVPYNPPEVEQKPDEAERRLERLIDQVRRQLVEARLIARCAVDGEQQRTFQMRIELDAPLSKSLPADVDCSIRPISLAPDMAVRFKVIDRQIAVIQSAGIRVLNRFLCRKRYRARKGSQAHAGVRPEIAAHRRTGGSRRAIAARHALKSREATSLSVHAAR